MRILFFLVGGGRRVALAGLSCAAFALTLGVLPGSAAQRHPLSTCFWVGPYDNVSHNVAFPDAASTYWSADYRLPAGATLRLHGVYAHARYQSLQSYNEETGTPVDSRNDVSTVPDPGSANPYRVGASRTVSRRSYTLRIAAEPPPAAPRPDTLYAGVNGQPRALLAYRLYVPDKGRDRTGGVGLPEPEVQLADGRRLEGQDACSVLDVSHKFIPGMRVPLPLYKSLRHWSKKPSTWPAQRPASWLAFYSVPFTLRCQFRLRCGHTPKRVGGMFSNKDNQYVDTWIDRRFGPVIVIHGKLPRTPHTLNGEPRMGSGQMRYWSLCNNQGWSTRVTGCLFDEQVRTDRDGYYTIVTSLPRDRPSNATARCGVGYIKFPAAGDGAGDRTLGFLLLRNMLPNKRFTHAVQDTKVAGDERSVMGPYLPTIRYENVRRFERRGCHPAR